MAILINDISATGPLEQGIDFRISSEGPVWVRTVIGAASQVAALIPLYSINAESIEFKNDAPKATLTAKYTRHPITGAEAVQNRIEIKTEIEAISVLANDRYIGLSPAIKKAIQRALDSNLPFSIDGASPAENSCLGLIILAAGGNPGPTVIATAEDAFTIMLVTPSFENYVTSLTYTRTVSPYFSTKLSRATLGYIFSTAAVSAYVGDPIVFDVPALTTTADDVTNALVGGWRKRLSDVNAIAGGSRQLVENWLLAKWSSKLYPLDSGSTF